jgi:hypothetical protein
MDTFVEPAARATTADAPDRAASVATRWMLAGAAPAFVWLVLLWEVDKPPLSGRWLACMAIPVLMVLAGAGLARRAGRSAFLGWALGLGIGWMAIEVLRALEGWGGSLRPSGWYTYWAVLVVACVVPVRRVVRRFAAD